MFGKVRACDNLQAEEGAGGVEADGGEGGGGAAPGERGQDQPGEPKDPEAGGLFFVNRH